MFRFALNMTAILSGRLLRFVGDFKNNLTARVASGYLLLRFHRFRKWESLSSLAILITSH
jgi:hypothetical protein